MINSNKRPLESFVTALAGQTAIPTEGTLVNAQGNIGLNNGQLGIISASLEGSLALNSFVAGVTPTMAESPVVAFVQGTANSANVQTATVKYPLPGALTYRTTGSVDFRQPVSVTKQAYRAPSHAVTVIGNTSGQANAINAIDNTTYELAIQFRGRRAQEFTSTQENGYLRASITTPDFTALSYTAAQKVDYIATTIAYDINRNSRAFGVTKRFAGNNPVVAFLVNSTGAGVTGVNIGGGSPITAGTSVPTFTYQGQTHNIVLTDAMATSIKNAAVAAAGVAIASLTWEIVPVNIANAGLNSEDIVMLVALDEVEAYVDFIPEIKVDMVVSLTRGFTSAVRNAKLSFADEGQGLARQLELFYGATQAQREYSLRHDLDPYVRYPNLFVENGTYDVYNVLHQNNHAVDIASVVEYRKRAIISVPTSLSGTLGSTLDSWFTTMLGLSNNGAMINL